jgi:triosephosphate isomerase (TIM)
MKNFSKFLLIGNMKMNPMNREEMNVYEIALQEAFQNISLLEAERDVEIALAPPFFYVKSLYENLSGRISVGVQDVSPYEKGSYTGDISASMAYSEGASFSLVGHSERRKYHQENNEDIAKKIRSLLDVGMKAVLCVGESQEDRNTQKTENVIKKQVTECLSEVKVGEIFSISLVYEPIWAVGSDETPTSLEIRSTKKIIQNILYKLFGEEGGGIKILYGGSVHIHNLLDTCITSGMDGALVGRSALDPKEFLEMASQARIV